MTKSAAKPQPMALPILAVLGAMVSFQVGAAFAKALFPAVGPQGAAALRIGLGAAALFAVLRPWRRWPRPAPVLPLVGLGVTTATAIVCFYQALTHLPLGVAIALQFLGPLAVAIFGSRRPSDLVWAGLAATGVWLMTGAAQGALAIDVGGLPWALGAAVSWALYILCGRIAAPAFGAATAPLAVGIAALIVLPVGVAHAGAALFDPALLPIAVPVAMVSTAIPFWLEVYALARMPARTFAIFTSLEPSFGVLAGLVVLREQLAIGQLAGVAAVIAAATGAAWATTRQNARAGAAETLT
jgi:inner membrane transporter RhtA